MANKLPKRFYPSGLNSVFPKAPGDFDHYVQQQRNMVRQTRLDVHGEKDAWIVHANAPNTFMPENFHNQPHKRGLLLIHGLTASPFILHDIAQHYSKAGFMVRTILLPGHGTVPGDLLNVHYSAWIEATRYGVESFHGLVDDLYVGGLSLGAALSVYAAYHYPQIKGLLLLAPAFHLKQRIGYMAKWHYLFSWLNQEAKWIRLAPDKAHTRYESFAFNAAAQTIKLMQLVVKLSKNNPLDLPMFMAISEQDEIVSPQAATEFFREHRNKNSQFILYSKHQQNFNDPRMHQLSSHFPHEHIVDFSHHCLPVSPDNPYYGRQSGFVDILHYMKRVQLTSLDGKPTPKVKGATLPENLNEHNLQRLSYNPDYDNMMKRMDNFIKSISLT